MHKEIFPFNAFILICLYFTDICLVNKRLFLFQHLRFQDVSDGQYQSKETRNRVCEKNNEKPLFVERITNSHENNNYQSRISATSLFHFHCHAIYSLTDATEKSKPKKATEFPYLYNICKKICVIVQTLIASERSFKILRYCCIQHIIQITTTFK